jgi:hypothetical protein
MSLSFTVLLLSGAYPRFSFGNKLQNLVYRDSAGRPIGTGRKWLYGLAMIGGGWLWARLNRYSTTAGWGDYPEASSRFA